MQMAKFFHQEFIKIANRGDWVYYSPNNTDSSKITLKMGNLLMVLR